MRKANIYSKDDSPPYNYSSKKGYENTCEFVIIALTKTWCGTALRPHKSKLGNKSGFIACCEFEP